ncbi:hypothetical protein LVJ83_03250 [Uruburuella testudinis]|uniref:Lipoprotein n=1 Tax=Uruburuella testudinis TaxID=1282863 RepID=A0ABY4DVK4_9NEIS|nr:hypothetical protein [Uruburuella testudinis]UOO82498.1 hypothetical protein LVJ83_03250 [Uruburuella testudinis]
MKIAKMAAIGVFSLVLSGCFMAQKSERVHKQEAYQPASDARLRLYGAYGNQEIRLHRNSRCADWQPQAGQRVHSRFVNGLPRRIRNEVVGMPDTERSVTAAKDKGMVLRDSYREFVVPAGKALVLDASKSITTDSRHQSCRTAVSFVPKAGKDYEAAFRWLNRSCIVEVFEIGAKPAGNGVYPRTMHQVEQCRAPRTSI